MSQQLIYYNFLSLPEPVRKVHKIRSKVRLDCTRYADDAGYKGLQPFINRKGQLFFYLTPARQFVTGQAKRIAEWSLTQSSLNLTSLYIEDFDNPEYAFGYPNRYKKLSNGTQNPLYEYRSDAYLFILDTYIRQVEMIVVPEQRNMISNWYQLLLDGELDDDIQNLRDQSQPFFDYGL